MNLTTKRLKQLIRDELENVTEVELDPDRFIKGMLKALERAEDETNLARMNVNLHSTGRNASNTLKNAEPYQKNIIKQQAEKVMKHVEQIIATDGPSQQNGAMVKNSLALIKKAAS